MLLHSIDKVDVVEDGQREGGREVGRELDGGNGAACGGASELGGPLF